jgi:hypothetical protein
MNTAITIPEKKGTVDTDDEGAVGVSHEGSFTMRYRDRPLKPALVALNLEDGNRDSDLNTAEVTECYLFAPIDVVPGKAKNQVPIGHGQVAVAALATKTMPTKDLKPDEFRFGPGEAKAKSSERRDVNGDHRDDLVLRFGSVDAGLTCSTRTVLLKGKAPKGGTYEGTDKVKPVNC